MEAPSIGGTPVRKPTLAGRIAPSTLLARILRVERHQAHRAEIDGVAQVGAAGLGKLKPIAQSSAVIVIAR
jgi:hypothetical protein